MYTQKLEFSKISTIVIQNTLCVDERSKRIEKAVFSEIPVYVWT